MAATQQIAIELVAKMDGLARDFNQATNVAETSAQKMQTAFMGVKTAIVTVGAALLGGFSVDYFAGIVKGSIAAAAGLKDLSEQTGASVSSLSALKGVGKLTETGIDSVTNAMGKFAKGLAGVDEESKGVPMALKAIGLDFERIKTMRPEDAMLAVAKAMEGFEDGTGKASVAMALYGKEGAKMIPFLKDLATVGELNGRVTKEQAEMADEYEKNLVRLKATSESWKRDLAMGLLPTLDNLAQVMLEVSRQTGGFREEMHKLSADGSITGWADKAVEGLAFVANAGEGVVRVFQAIGTVIAGTAASTAALFKGISFEDLANGATNPISAFKVASQLQANRQGAKDVTAGALQDIETALTKGFFGDKFLARFKQIRDDKKFIAPGVTEWYDGADSKQKINANWGYKLSGGAKAKSETSDYEKLTRTLKEKIAVQQEELGLTEKITDAAKEYAKFQTQIKEGYIKLSPEELKQAEELWKKFLAQAEELRAKAKQKTFEAARLNIQTLNESFARENANKRASMEIMPAADRALIEAKNAIEEKGKAEADKFAAQLRKNEIEVDQYTKLMNELTAAIERQKGEVTALADLQNKLNASFEYGAERALQSYLDDIANVAASAESLFTNAFKGMEDALVNFVQTGKLDFKSLVNSILADMARISIRENITGPLARWMQGSSSGGSSGGGLGSFFGFFSNLFGGGGDIGSPRWDLNALGGVYSSPSLSAFSGSVVNRPTAFAFANGAGLMGEAGPEAILPLKRGSNGKLGVQSGGGRAVNITVNVSGNSSAPDVRRAAGQGAREALAAFNGAGRYS